MTPSNQMIGRAHRLFSVLLITILMLILQPVIEAQEHSEFTNPLIAGYLMRPSAGGIALQSVDQTGKVSSTTFSIPDVVLNDELDSTWDIGNPAFIALSPDLKAIAFTAVRLLDEMAVFVYDLERDTLVQYPLPPSTAQRLQPVWAPDGSRIFLASQNLIGKTTSYMLNLRTGQISALETTYLIGLHWLPDHNRLLHIGPAGCAAPCSADNDLYLIDISELTHQPITKLHPSELEIADRMTDAYIGFGVFTWNPHDERIYVRLGEPGEGTARPLELIYSTGLTGDLRLEADIGTVYPASGLVTKVHDIFANPLDKHIYTITHTEGPEADIDLRWSIMRLDNNGSMMPVYEKDFEYTDVNILIYSTVSPDGRYVAMAGSDPSRAENGQLVVVDLVTGHAILDLSSNLRPVCNVHFTSHTSIVYTQSETRCLDWRAHQPSNQVIYVDLVTGIQTELITNPSGVTYFIPAESSPSRDVGN